MQSRSFRSSLSLSSLIAIILFAGACAKKPQAPAPAPPPAAPAPARPTVTLNASNSMIHQGESVTLNWSSTNATDLDLEPGVGKVAPEGQTSISPTASATYTITATGPGGTADASVRVTVGPAPQPVPVAAPSKTLQELFDDSVRDTFYDFNKSDVRPDARDTLSKDAEFFRQHPEVRFTIEGHCDERGSTEYNLGLGERRAQAAKNFLISLGITADHIETVSYGKEHPFCTQSNEDCWQQNRRAHFVMIASR
ncbi:MAG: peptidoglycan-associated lipoprotein Pal [Candidatus Acidiferrales bacterium]